MTSPRIWVLLDDRPGHHTQVLGLAQSLGVDFETRSLRFNRFSRVPNGLLGARRLTLDRTRSEELAPPYPDLVIAMGRRCVPVARWIRKASGHSSRLVQLGRKGLVAPEEFALQISCAHFNLPTLPQRIAVTLPPTQVTAARLREARTEWPGLMNGSGSPKVVLLVGGDSAHHRLEPDAAADIVRRAERAAARLGGSLTVVTSRRTSAEAITAMQAAAEGVDFHLWRAGETRNPYLGYLAWADVLIVTGESESMLAEAAATAKPLYVAALSPKPVGPKRRARRWMTTTATRDGGLASVCRRILNSGWIAPYRDLEKMHSLMYEAGLARPFETELDLASPPPTAGLQEVRERLSPLLAPARVAS